VVFVVRRLCGIMDWYLSSGFSGSESMSRDERPRCAVRALAADRMEDCVIYCRGKGWIVL
jgi:hypothetical protein